MSKGSFVTVLIEPNGGNATYVRIWQFDAPSPEDMIEALKSNDKNNVILDAPCKNEKEEVDHILNAVPKDVNVRLVINDLYGNYTPWISEAVSHLANIKEIQQLRIFKSGYEINTFKV